MNVIIPLLKQDQMMLMFDSILRVYSTQPADIANEDTNTIEIERFMTSDDLIGESSEMQCALIGSIWRCVVSCLKKKREESKSNIELISIISQLYEDERGGMSDIWLKEHNTTPNANQSTNCNEMWTHITHLGKQLEGMMLQSHEPIESFSGLHEDEENQKNIKSIKVPIHVSLLYIPLEYLSPGNQMRYLIGVSAILFGFKYDENMDEQFLHDCLDTMLLIFDGVRSVWFFNYINFAKYICCLLNVLRFKENQKLKEKFKLVISKLIDNALRGTQFAKNLQELVDSIQQQQVDSSSSNSSSFDSILITENSLLAHCIPTLSRQSLHKTLAVQRESIVLSANKLARSIYSRLKKCLSSPSGEDIDAIDPSLVVECYVTLFEFQFISQEHSQQSIGKKSKSKSEDNETNKQSMTTINLKTKWNALLSQLIAISLKQLSLQASNESCYKFLTLLCRHRNKMNNILPDDFVMNIINIIMPSKELEEDESSSFIPLSFRVGKMKEDITYEKILSKMNKHKELRRSVLLDGRKEFLANLSTQKEYLNVSFVMLQEFIKCTTEEEFAQIVDQLSANMKRCHYHKSALQLMAIIRAIFTSGIINEEKNVMKRNKLSQVVGDLLVNLTRLCNQCNEEYEEHQDASKTTKSNIKNNQLIQLNVKIEILDTCKLILAETSKHQMISPAHLFSAFNCCIEANLEKYIDNDYAIFVPLYQAVYSILNESLLSHRFIVISAMSTFIVILQQMLKCLIVASEQEKVGEDDWKREKLEVCAQNMDRLLTQCSMLDCDEFKQQIAPHLVAFYVTQSQSVTIHLVVKRHLLSSMNRVLKVITEKEKIEMIHSRLKQSGREIFKLLYDNYEKYYQFKGQI